MGVYKLMAYDAARNVYYCANGNIFYKTTDFQTYTIIANFPCSVLSVDVCDDGELLITTNNYVSISTLGGAYKSYNKVSGFNQVIENPSLNAAIQATWGVSVIGKYVVISVYDNNGDGTPRELGNVYFSNDYGNSFELVFDYVGSAFNTAVVADECNNGRNRSCSWVLFRSL